MRSRSGVLGRSTIAGLVVAGVLTASVANVLAQQSPSPSPVVSSSPVPVSSAAPSPVAAGLVVSAAPGYLPVGLPGRYERRSGMPVTVRSHASDRELADRLAAGETAIDVAIVSAATAQALAAAGLLASIDHALVPNLVNLYPEATRLPTDPGNTWSVPYTWGTTGLCYRTDLLAAAPEAWTDLLTPAEDARGRTTMLGSSRWLLLPALKSLGHSANTTDPAQLEAARQLLLEAKPALLAYDDTTFHQRLVRGEVALAEAWDSWCNYAVADPEVGDDVAFVLPEEGSDLWVDVLVIPATAADPAAAHAFLDQVLRPAMGVSIVESLLYKVPNRAAMRQLPDDLLERFPTLGIRPARLVAQESLVDLGDATGRYDEIADEVRAP
jgi:spermidine/putrescine transport system substrate-binding protein